jgi:hypothetical protein
MRDTNEERLGILPARLAASREILNPAEGNGR